MDIHVHSRMHVTCTIMDEDEGTSTCAANFINSY